MQIIFQVNYHTVWGEEVVALFPDGTVFPLRTPDGAHWQGVYEPPADATELTYRYAIRQGDEITRKEWNGVARRLALNPGYHRYILSDAWRDRPDDAYFYTDAFHSSLPSYPTGTETTLSRAVLLKVRCPRLRHESWQMAVSGNQDCFGHWDMSRPSVMTPCGPNEWALTLDASQLTDPFEYKFLAWDTQSGHEGEWIVGDNRRRCQMPVREGELLVLSDDEVHFPLPTWKGAGVAIPVFSLRSATGWGVGDFGDLIQMIDWAANTGQRVVQILPIYDTTITGTWTDSYPYSSISIYAFHPMFVDVRQLPPLKDTAAAEAFERERARLNDLPQVDYEAVNKLKRDYLRAVFAQEGAATEKTEAYQRFVAENEDWLFPYAVFCHLRDFYGTADYARWPSFQRYDAALARDLVDRDQACADDTRFYRYVQFQLHVQLRAASDHAHARGVRLKGDIPIGVDPHSVETWTEPHYFNLDGQAGAPPDPFSATGQNWGLPTYNWETMRADGYRWWKRRLGKMAEYFDAYRIDHILGFFRIWEIPSHSVQGLLGQFVPAIPMSPREIEGFGVTSLWSRPYIKKDLLEKLFGEMAREVEENYLCRLPNEQFALRPDYDTQRKIEAHFDGQTDECATRLREGLYRLCNQVLFVADRRDPGLFHPRIGVLDDYVYECLPDGEKNAFRELYVHYFYHRHNDFWAGEAMRKLPELIDSTRMLVCGEDLGMIPACVPGVMDALRILSLEVQRMPKNPGELFGSPMRYPYRSVCTISTHDMSTLRGWWHEEPERTRDYYYYLLGAWGQYPDEAPGWLCETIVMRHLLGNSMLCVLALQDWLSIDERIRQEDPEAERINVPAHRHHYWRYRMPFTLERLLSEKDFNKKLKRMIQDAGR